jgi:hypothetical protein
MSQMLRGRNARHASATRRAQHTLRLLTQASAPRLTTTLAALLLREHLISTSVPLCHPILRSAAFPARTIVQSMISLKSANSIMAADGFRVLWATTTMARPSLTHSAPYLSVSGSSTNLSPTSPKSYSGGSQVVAGYNHLLEGEYFDGGYVPIGYDLQWHRLTFASYRDKPYCPAMQVGRLRL